MKALETLRVGDAAAWERWLEQNHLQSSGVWLHLGKKGGGRTALTYREALLAALCFGWIDGQVKRYDEQSYLQRFTPRRPKSSWSQINVQHVADLVAAGRMRPAGQREVEAAQADGRWEAAYAPPSKIAPPPELQVELDKDRNLASAFAGWSSSKRYSALYRLHQAKKPETRQRWVQRILEMLRTGR